MTSAVVKRISELWFSWKTEARVIQLTRLCGRYDDCELIPVVDEMADDASVPFFDARILFRRVSERVAAQGDDAFERLGPRARHAAIHRREWAKHAKLHPDPRHPEFAQLDDDAILTLVEQQTRNFQRQRFGYVRPHFSYLTMREELGDPRPEAAR